MLVFVLWAKGILSQLPLVVVFENVCRFPLGLLMSLFNSLYDIDNVILRAVDFGSPCQRQRRYCIMTRRRHIRLARPMADLIGLLTRGTDSELASKDMCFGERVGYVLSASALKYKATYMRVHSQKEAFYDLSQNPEFMTRVALGNEPLFTLTTSSSLV